MDMLQQWLGDQRDQADDFVRRLRPGLVLEAHPR
jgi:hypothetical protein